ncbi:MAG: endonuclease III, partial [Pseudomonas sp.]|nr:endonuclease III [Pseudomonas sp.]
MNATKRHEIFRRLREDDPEPKTELAYSTPFELLIAVILSAQATDVGVNKATAKLFQVADTPEEMLELGEEGLIPYIASIGLYRTKARNVIRAAEILQSQYGGEVPLTRDALQSL